VKGAEAERKKVTSADLLSIQMKSSEADDRDELQRYLDEKAVDPETMTGSVLQWWKV
jgi:hypothetical protein